jgi:hypothetical protein
MEETHIDEKSTWEISCRKHSDSESENAAPEDTIRDQHTRDYRFFENSFDDCYSSVATGM